MQDVAPSQLWTTQEDESEVGHGSGVLRDVDVTGAGRLIYKIL